MAVDLGAAAGGFTRVLLEAGARRAYAVDAGHGQLLGSLRQSERVVNLESTNLGDLTAAMIGEPVDVVTADLSYVSLASALAQLTIDFAPAADAVLLVKPMFELGLSTPPTDEAVLQRALAVGVAGIEAAGWRVPRLDAISGDRPPRCRRVSRVVDTLIVAAPNYSGRLGSVSFVSRPTSRSKSPACSKPL